MIENYFGLNKRLKNYQYSGWSPKKYNVLSLVIQKMNDWVTKNINTFW